MRTVKLLDDSGVSRRSHPDDLADVWSSLAMPQLLIADDHALYRRGFREIVEESIEGAVVHETDSLDGAEYVLGREHVVDLAVLNLSRPGQYWPADIRNLPKTFQHTRFSLLADHDSHEVVLTALAGGFHGCISKSQPDHEILAAICAMLSGRIYVPSWLSQPRSVMPAQGDLRDVRSAQAANISRLSSRQQEVLALMSKGLSNKEIAHHLSIAEATAKIHVSTLMRTLGVKNRTSAALLAREQA